MTSLIIYSTTEVRMDALGTFTYPGFEQLAHGEFRGSSQTFWYVYGEQDLLDCPRGVNQTALKGADAMYYLIIEANRAKRLLELCETFGQHVQSRDTDIECNAIEASPLQQRIAQLFEQEKRKRAETRLV
jgi:hypothetical protein